MGSKWTNIAIVGGILLLALIIAFLGYGKNKAVDEAVEEREGMVKDLVNGARTDSEAGLINPDDIKVAGDRRVQIETERAGILAQAINWNVGRYTIPELQMLNGQMRPALPFDEKVYAQNQLATRFAEAYHKQLEDMLQSLKPTWLPDEELIQEEAIRQQKTIDKLNAIETKEGTLPRGNYAPGMMPDMMPDMMPPEERGYRPSRRTGRDANVQVSAEATQRAVDVLRLRQAQVGLIYATKDALFQALPEGPTPSLAPGQVWDAWISLCVQRDLIDAIKATNDEVLAQRPDATPSVALAPIKRLARIYVDPRSIVESKAGASPSAGGYAPGMYDPGMYDPGMYDPSMMGMSPGGTAAVGGVETLSERKTNPKYEVVRYEFTVLMPTRHLPQLQKNLMKQNYHTVLNQNIYASLPEAMAAATAAGRVGPADARSGSRGRMYEPPSRMTGRGQNQEADLFYYGTEAYRAVTIRGELLLLTDWTRGTFDETTKTWSRPPLMPKAVVEQLPGDALRPTDSSRLSGAIPAWTFEPPKPAQSPNPEDEPVEQTPVDATTPAVPA